MYIDKNIKWKLTILFFFVACFHSTSTTTTPTYDRDYDDSFFRRKIKLLELILFSRTRMRVVKKKKK